MYTISKRFEFSASHQLRGLPKDHPCGRHHGHNYIVEVELQSPLVSSVGFVRDYGELSALKRYIDTEFDHQHLNERVAFNPTAELLARHFYNYAFALWPELTAVRVSETPKTWAEYRPSRIPTGDEILSTVQETTENTIEVEIDMPPALVEALLGLLGRRKVSKP